MFDPPASVPFSKITSADNDTDAHNQIALRMARESLVLLKNKGGFLPLKHPPATIAVIGPNADSLDALEGNYNGTPSKPVTVLAGIRKRFSHSKVVYVQGTGLIGPVVTAIPSAALYTDRSLKKHGLKAEYFSNPKLESKPILTRTDAKVDFAWGFSGVSPELSKN